MSTGDGQENSQVIHIVGYVDPIPMGVMAVNPRKVAIGSLVAGKENKVPLKITNAGDAPMKVTAVKSQKFHTTYWEGEETVAAGQSVSLDLAITPAKAGRFLDIIMVFSDARNDIGRGYKAVLLGKAQ